MAGQRDSQQGSHCHRKTWINVLLGTIHLLLPFIQRGGAQFQALSDMSSVVEVWQAEDSDFFVPSQAVEVQHTESLPQEESSSFYVRDSGKPLCFQPAVLDFSTQPVGLPRAETVYIHNPSAELPITLQSVVTSSKHFHMPNFHRRVIPPRGKTSFKLVFLPTEEGNVENSLFINTSTHGVISYQVFGVGVAAESGQEELMRKSVLVFPHVQSITLTQTQEDALNMTILGLLLDCSLHKSLHTQPQSWCFGVEGEGRLSLQIRLAERGEKSAHLDKLKPYVLENIMVLLLLLPRDATPNPRIGVYMLNSGLKQLSVKEIQILSRTVSSVEMNQVELKASASNLTRVATLSCTRSLSSPAKKCSNQIGLEILTNSTVNVFPWLDIRSAVWWWFELRQKQKGLDDVELWLMNSLPFHFNITHISLLQPLPRLFKVVNVSRAVVASPGCWQLLKLHLLNSTLPINLIAVLTLSTSLGFTWELPLHTFSTGTKQGYVVFETGAECERTCPLRLSRAGRLEWQQSLLPESFSALWKVDSSLATALCSRWHCSKELSCRWPRLPADGSISLDFGATPVNESKIKSFSVKNPTGSVVSVEIRTLASYPAPLEALDLLTKWFHISPISVNITTSEFSLLPHDYKSEGERASSSSSVLRMILQPWESRSVSVLYTPTEHKPVTSLLLVRNNLTVFDMVLVKGFGAKELLRVGGKLPGVGASLRFNVPQSTLMECRDGPRSHTNKPLFAIKKSFKVENAGELPLTVMSMNINGYKCQGFGFEVLQCRSFSVDYNSSSEITIAFTPDFTSSWVIRDLTLVTARGSSFPFTLNVTLPHHMLPLCAQVVPGPSWEESFWLITLLFTCFSLVGVCLMAFHQAQYILREFSTPTSRSNHNSNTLRENGSIAHGNARAKGSCKTFSDMCHTSDKGKGRGSTALANGGAAVRSQPPSSKKGSGGSTQQAPKKQTHKLSFLYSRYKSSSAVNSSANANVTTDEEVGGTFEPDADVSNNNNITQEQLPDESLVNDEKKLREKKSPPLMFPMETLPVFAENVATNQVPRSAEGETGNRCGGKREAEKTENTDVERESKSIQKVKVEQESELTVPISNTKSKKSSAKSRRRSAAAVSGLPENAGVTVTEIKREVESQEARNAARNCSHPVNTKLELPKGTLTLDSPVKQNGASLGRGRRRVPERRPQWESGSDSGSSSGSVRASRGSWGSWSSASSVEGDKEHSRTHCSSQHKREPVQYGVYPADRDCYLQAERSFKNQSLYEKDLAQNSECSAATFGSAFGDVTTRLSGSSYVSEESWSAPSVPLTNGFRYNSMMPETLSLPPHSAPYSPYSSFPWSSVSSQSSNSYPYCQQSNYILPGHGNYQSSFSCQENPAVSAHQQGWSEDSGQEVASSWDITSCVGSKPFFSGTRSLSPISSSLFGSIWTPQSEPYQSHFQPDRSAPNSPHSSPHSPPLSNRQPPGPPHPKHYSSFNPFGPHMNLDIWNSSSNKSSNSQLSNDSGYCGDA